MRLPCHFSHALLALKLRDCLASRRPLLVATLRNTCRFRHSDDPIVQICKGFFYGRTEETRNCQMCPHESPHSSHAEFACSIRIEAVRTMSRMCRYLTQSFCPHHQFFLLNFSLALCWSQAASSPSRRLAQETRVTRQKPLFFATYLQY